MFPPSKVSSKVFLVALISALASPAVSDGFNGQLSIVHADDRDDDDDRTIAARGSFAGDIGGGFGYQLDFGNTQLYQDSDTADTLGFHLTYQPMENLDLGLYFGVEDEFGDTYTDTVLEAKYSLGDFEFEGMTARERFEGTGSPIGYSRLKVGYTFAERFTVSAASIDYDDETYVALEVEARFGSTILGARLMNEQDDDDSQIRFTFTKVFGSGVKFDHPSYLAVFDAT